MKRILRSVLLLGLCLSFLGVFSIKQTRAFQHQCAHGHNCPYCNRGHRHEHEAHGLFDTVRDQDDHEEDHDVSPFSIFGSGWAPDTPGVPRQGAPSTLTWSIAPDGTSLPGDFITTSGSSGGINEPSDLISFLDGVHHGGNSPGGNDLTQRDWWHLFNDSFERWDELSGISFSYEPQDDGRPIGSFSGVSGVRGDHRIGGHSLDGSMSPTTLAFNYFPSNSDMVIDTDEIGRWSNATNNYRIFRNMLMHEIGHGIGLRHVEPVNQTKLMEAFLSTAYDGPQFDDILGAHRLYGDVNEEGTGNDLAANATELGSLHAGQIISIGTDAVDSFVASDEVDFVSIDDNSDVDYFKFSISQAQTVNIDLTPLGPTYDLGSPTLFNASALNDLSLTLYNTNGSSVLEHSNDTGIGQSEDINGFFLSNPGEYFVRVGGGQQNAPQFFQLDITAVPEPTSLALFALAMLGYAASRKHT